MSSRMIMQVEPDSAPSLATVLTTLDAGELPERKRQELASAVRTVARALSKSPEDVPADARWLGSRLKDVAPAAIGISRGRWNNVRCLFRSALCLVQPISPGRNGNDLLPQWRALSEQLTSRSDQIALSRMLRFLSSRGIARTTWPRRPLMPITTTSTRRC